MSNEAPVFVHSNSTEQWYNSVAGSLLTAGERTKNVLLYSSAYLVFIAMMESVIVLSGLAIPFNHAPVVIGLLTFAVYTGDRIADVDSDEVDKRGQVAFIRRHKTTLSGSTALAYGLAIAISIVSGPFALALTLLPGAFWVLYASDWLPTLGGYFKRLKDVLVVNSAIVALAWAITLALFPVIIVDATITPAVAIVFAYFFVDRFINTEIPNLRDMDGDEAIGVSTLPVVFGETRTRQILEVMTTGLFGFVAYAGLEGYLSNTFSIALLIGLAYTFILTWFIGRTNRYGRLSVASEMKHVVVFFALLGL